MSRSGSCRFYYFFSRVWEVLILRMENFFLLVFIHEKKIFFNEFLKIVHDLKIFYEKNSTYVLSIIEHVISFIYGSKQLNWFHWTQIKPHGACKLSNAKKRVNSSLAILFFVEVFPCCLFIHSSAERHD